MNMTPRDLAKKIAVTIVQYGTGAIVYETIKTNVVVDRIDQKIAVGAASMAIGGIVADATAARTEKIVDDIFDEVAKIRKRF